LSKHLFWPKTRIHKMTTIFAPHSKCGTSYSFIQEIWVLVWKASKLIWVSLGRSNPHIITMKAQQKIDHNKSQILKLVCCFCIHTSMFELSIVSKEDHELSMHIICLLLPMYDLVDLKPCIFEKTTCPNLNAWILISGIDPRP